MRRIVVALLLSVSVVAHAEPAATLSADALAKLSRCPLDASLCEEVAERTKPEVLRAACAEKKPGACIAAAYATAVTRRFRTPRLAAVRELLALCDAGQHAACVLALDVTPTLESAWENSVTHFTVEDPNAVRLPDDARLMAACTAGDWRSCEWVHRQAERYARPSVDVVGPRRASCVAGSRTACVGLEGAEDAGLRTASFESLCKEGQGVACLALAGRPAFARTLVEALPGYCAAGDLQSCSYLVRDESTRDAACKQLRTGCTTAACGRDVRFDLGYCGMPPTGDTVAEAELFCIRGKSTERCAEAARWYAKGVEGEVPEPEHAKWLAKLGCDHGDTASCAVRVEIGEPPEVIAEDLVARCAANAWSCNELFLAFGPKRAWFERSPTVRAVLDKQCRAGDLGFCRLSLDALEEGIGGKADVKAAVTESLRICEQLGSDCSDWMSFFRRSATERARLRCLLFAERCDVAGMPVPVKIANDHCEVDWGTVVGSHVVLGKQFGLEILDLATGKEAVKQQLFPDGIHMWHASIGGGPNGPAAVFDFSSSSHSNRMPRAWGPGLTGAPVELRRFETKWPAVVHSGARRAWVTVNGSRSVLVEEDDGEYFRDEAFVELVLFDLETGSAIGEPVPVPGLTPLDAGIDRRWLATSEDGNRLAVLLPGGVELIHVGGARQPVPTKLTVAGLALSEDGRRLAVWPEQRDGMLEVWDVAATPKLLWSAPGRGAVFTKSGTRIGVHQLGLSRLIDVETRRWVGPPAFGSDSMFGGGSLVPMQDGVFVGMACQILGPRPAEGPRPAWLDALPPFVAEETSGNDE